MENINNYDVIKYEEFQRIEIRVGTIVDAKEFPEARQPAIKLWVDFGEKLGVRKTSAQVTENYEIEDLIDRQVAAVINFPPKQIGKFMSELLVLGFPDDAGDVVLVNVDKSVPNGGRLF